MKEYGAMKTASKWTTEKLEAVQTRKLIDNINQEEERLIATKVSESPIDE